VVLAGDSEDVLTVEWASERKVSWCCLVLLFKIANVHTSLEPCSLFFVRHMIYADESHKFKLIWSKTRERDCSILRSRRMIYLRHSHYARPRKISAVWLNETTKRWVLPRTSRASRWQVTVSLEGSCASLSLSFRVSTHEVCFSFDCFPVNNTWNSKNSGSWPMQTMKESFSDIYKAHWGSTNILLRSSSG
jgi:hypothetical protein